MVRRSLSWDAFGRWFEEFCSQVSADVWQWTSVARARRFHGGVRCRQTTDPLSTKARHREMCPECAGAHHSTMLLMGQKAWPIVQAGGALDIRDFARQNTRDRFRDAVTKDEGAATGALQKLDRSVYGSKWVGQALARDPVDMALLADVLRFLHGQDRPEPGSWLPLDRLAARLEDRTGVPFSKAEVHQRIEAIVSRLRAAKPNWVAQHIDARTGHLTRTGSWEDLTPEGDATRLPSAPKEDAGELAWAAFSLLQRAAERREDAGDALRRVLAAIGRSDAVATLEANGDWGVLVADVAARRRAA